MPQKLNIIVEDGTIVPGANSYIGVEDANAFLLVYPEFDVWDALDDDEKAKLLMYATRVIDENVNFNGRKVSDLQPLEFPRKEAWDSKTGKFIPSNIVPASVKNATAIFALAIANGFVPSSAGVGGDCGSVSIGGIISVSDCSPTTGAFPVAVLNYLQSIAKPIASGSIASFQIDRI